MPGELTLLPWAEVTARAARSATVVWASDRARRALGPEWPTATWLTPDGRDAGAAASASTVIAVGGGALLDHVKLTWRARAPAATTLVAVPTVWGSGAEASPVAVWTADGRKQFRLDPELRPHAIGFDPRFAATVSRDRARAACGDVWAHAIEGFLSPLASDALRARLAALIGRLLELPVAADGRWFEPGAEAAALQARSSVGLVHGLAHVLEPVLAPGVLGHARLCALLLAPVLRWNAATSTTWAELSARFGVDRTGVEATVATLGEVEARRALIPAVEASWRQVLRDPCTRTNSALVRPNSLAGLVAELEAAPVGSPDARP